jgi:hypothetical protein
MWKTGAFADVYLDAGDEKMFAESFFSGARELRPTYPFVQLSEVYSNGAAEQISNPCEVLRRTLWYYRSMSASGAASFERRGIRMPVYNLAYSKIFAEFCNVHRQIAEARDREVWNPEAAAAMEIDDQQYLPASTEQEQEQEQETLRHRPYNYFADPEVQHDDSDE